MGECVWTLVLNSALFSLYSRGQQFWVVRELGSIELFDFGRVAKIS